MSCNGCTTKVNNFNSENLYTWCTNCGNYGIHAGVKRALVESEIEPKDVLLCFDIGCHGNGSDKIGGYRFHGLHGRVLPFAAGASIANSKVKVIAFGGDGGTLGEGIGHLVASIRNNFNFTFIFHNNMNYGLTQGQSSATTRKDTKMNSSPDGTQIEPLHVMNFVLNLQPSFAARSFSGDVKHLQRTLKSAIQHKGFSFVEVFQSCPTYNKETPHEWYQERVFDVENIEGYDAGDLSKAINIAQDLHEKIAVGVIYKDDEKSTFDEIQMNRVGVNSTLVEEVKNYDPSDLVTKFI